MQTNKESLGPSEVAFRSTSLTLMKKNKTNQKKTKTKRAFQLSVEILLGGGVQKILFLTTWPRKRAPQNTIKIGVSENRLLKNSYASRNGQFLDKKTNPEIQLSFFFGSFLLCQQQKHNNLLKHLIL